jgi:hypothetical protein
METLSVDVLSKLKAGLEYTGKVSSCYDSTKNTRTPISRENIKNATSLCLRLKARRLTDAATATALRNVGFRHTGDGNTVCCDTCGLEVNSWTSNMDLHAIHSTKRPDCTFVRNKNPQKILATASSSIGVTRTASISDDQENPSKRQKTEASQENSFLNSLFESDQTQQIRRRTFSHYPHRTVPSQAQMIEAGFFNCNVGDRVICIYCNLICQQWTPYTDDPCEVHKTLSPNCIYVKAKLIRREPGSMLIVNETAGAAASGSRLLASNNADQFRCNEFVHTAACNPAYAELPKRTASYATSWPNDNLPAVDDLVRAGFFYTGTKTIVTCFYCNGSLQNWGPKDNPTIEHARWFPHCAYAKQLCGDELYRKIQESKRAQQGLFDHYKLKRNY